MSELETQAQIKVTGALRGDRALRLFASESPDFLTEALSYSPERGIEGFLVAHTPGTDHEAIAVCLLDGDQNRALSASGVATIRAASRRTRIPNKLLTTTP